MFSIDILQSECGMQKIVEAFNQAQVKHEKLEENEKTVLDSKEPQQTTGCKATFEPVSQKVLRAKRRAVVLASKIECTEQAFVCASSEEKQERKRERLELSRDEESEKCKGEHRSNPDWNAKFQKAVRRVNKLFEFVHSGENIIECNTSTKKPNVLRNSNEDLYSRRQAKILKTFSKLADLYHNFIDTATLYGKIIISERYLPIEQKTIKPSSELGGIAGGEKYIVHNIIFKFCTDHVGLFGSDHNSQKLASHELKGLIHSFNHGSRIGLCFPMMTAIDYKGFKVIAMSRLPIRGNETLVWGSRDAAATILCEPNYRDKLKLIGMELGLKAHKVRPLQSMNSSETILLTPEGENNNNIITMYTPVVCELLIYLYS